MAKLNWDAKLFMAALVFGVAELVIGLYIYWRVL